jgi:tetratricopeptide (TPR) repeat protein
MLMRHRITGFTACAGAALIVAGAVQAQTHGGGAAAAGAQGAAPLYDNLGDYHRTVSTYLPLAQRYFDQGYRLLFAFNLEEAERSFREAAKIDPTCSACQWGIAMALGPHINFPATPERTVAAAKAAAEAVRLAVAGKLTPVEQALAEAIAKRYSDPAPANPEGQSALDTAYAEAMRGVAKRFPGDADVQYLAIEALMNLHPWDLYESDGTAKAWTPEIVAMLEAALAKAPEHPGLCHLYIHAVEASATPNRAVTAAERLRTKMPGAGHLVHMPSHIFARVGRYADSALANERAVAADSVYLPDATNFMMYPMYAAHNHQFLWLSAMMEGRSAIAFVSAQETAARLPLEMLRSFPGFDAWKAYPYWTLVRFGEWRNVLALPVPDGEFPYLLAMARTARAIAFARSGELAAAEAERATAGEALAKVPAEAMEGFNPVTKLGAIALAFADAEILRARGDLAAAAATLEPAVTLEDGLRYSEPSDWYFPVRPWQGSLLLEAGKTKEAEAVFRKDLEKNVENGWALTGLAAALRRQGREQEAAAVDRRIGLAWSRADLELDRMAAPAERSARAATATGGGASGR